MLKPILLLALLLVIATSQCDPTCLTCQLPSSPFSCTACASPNSHLYFFECIYEANIAEYILIFEVVAVLMVAVHFFMLAMGLGVYSGVFQVLQMVVLVNWRQNRFGGGIVGWQYLSLAGVSNNSFPATFGAQFIVVMIILGLFWLMLIFVNKIPHKPTANFVHKMKVTLSLRIITFIFNILLFASMMQVTTTATQPQFKTFAYVLAILALVKIVMVLGGLAFMPNSKYFSVEDPTFYVLVEEVRGDQWYVRNNVLIGLLFRGAVILTFVLGFQQPGVSGIVMAMIQFFYFLYLAVFIKYTQIRYFIFILSANFIATAVLILSIFGTKNYPDSTHDSLGFYYALLTILIGALYLIATAIQIYLKNTYISRTLCYFYSKYIKCQKDILFEQYQPYTKPKASMELSFHLSQKDKAEYSQYTNIE